MNIEVTGSNNKVAGRDFIENNLNLGSEEIRTLGAILAKEINSLPKDGQPHSISVTVGGDQAGNISLGGTQINIQVSMNVEAIWIPVLVIGFLLGGLGLWMDRVRRVEHLHMENAQEMIDQIQAALRKKRR